MSIDEALIARVEAALFEAKASIKRRDWPYTIYPKIDHADLRALVAYARHHADEIAAYRAQLDTTQRALASVVAERDAATARLRALQPTYADARCVALSEAATVCRIFADNVLAEDGPSSAQPEYDAAISCATILENMIARSKARTTLATKPAAEGDAS